MRMLRTGVLLIAAVTIGSQMAGCIFPVIVGAVGAGAYSATDRRSLGAQTDDKVIASRVESRIEDALSDRSHINVNSFNRKVLLTGEVPDQASKDKAEQIAKSVDNVASVVSDLEIGGMTPSTARNNDAYLTGKVKAELVSRKDIFANAYKVVTEKSIVYLMGRVTREEGDRAAEAARGVSGVQKVVKVFDYLTDAELAQIQKSGSAQ
ncbi:MAG: BON domain-containing protein [Burkholderiaceae bacterium]